MLNLKIKILQTITIRSQNLFERLHFWNRNLFTNGILIFLALSLNSNCSFPIKSEMKIANGQLFHREIYTSGIGSGTRYHILLKYRYEVNGKIYESNKVWYFKIFYQTREAAEKSIQNYQLDKPLNVYYKPEDPSEAYLEVDNE